MSNSAQGLATVLSRLMLVTIFLLSALGNKIPNFSGTVQYMKSAGVPAPELLLVGAIVFLIVGGLSVLIGFQARIGASLLLVFLAAATWYFHDFWNFQGPEQQAQMIQFLKNLSLGGAMLFIVANGAGPFSVDAALARRAIIQPNEKPLFQAA
jgi:putative oxidoreductase